MIVQSTAHQKMFVSIIQQKSVQVSQLERALQRNEDEVERLNFVLKRRDERIVEKKKENQQLEVALKQVTRNLAYTIIIQCLYRSHRARRELKYRQGIWRWRAYYNGQHAAIKLQSASRGFLERRRRLNVHRQAWVDYKRRIGQLYDELIRPTRTCR